MALHYIIKRDSVDDCWVAHCKETGLYGHGDTPGKAIRSLEGATVIQIAESVKENNLANLFDHDVNPAHVLTDALLGSAIHCYE
jgi:predicted RNase H-like HicB family nuclease